MSKRTAPKSHPWRSRATREYAHALRKCGYNGNEALNHNERKHTPPEKTNPLQVNWKRRRGIEGEVGIVKIRREERERLQKQRLLSLQVPA